MRGKHWRDRGGGHQQPLGYDIVSPAGDGAVPFAVLASADAAWPKVKPGERAEGYQWQGYTLDEKHLPTFSYTWNGTPITDRFDTEPGAVMGEGKLIRTIRIEGQIPANAFLRAAAGQRIVAGEKGFTVQIGQQPLIVAVDGAKISGNTLLVPARQEIKISYSWQVSHAHHASAEHAAH
jgi:hypothetical protein